MSETIRDRLAEAIYQRAQLDGTAYSFPRYSAIPLADAVCEALGLDPDADPALIDPRTRLWGATCEPTIVASGPTATVEVRFRLGDGTLLESMSELKAYVATGVVR